MGIRTITDSTISLYEKVKRLYDGDDLLYPGPVYSRFNQPGFNGVTLTSIWKVYNKNQCASGFGGTQGYFWSSVAQSETFAQSWGCNQCDWFYMLIKQTD